MSKLTKNQDPVKCSDGRAWPSVIDAAAELGVERTWLYNWVQFGCPVRGGKYEGLLFSSNGTWGVI